MRITRISTLQKIGLRIGQALLLGGVLFLLCRTAASQSTYERDLQRLMNPSGKDWLAEDSIQTDFVNRQAMQDIDFFDLEISIDSLESDMRILEDRVENLEEENATLRSLLQEFAQADFDKEEQMAGAILFWVDDFQARIKALEKQVKEGK